VTAAPTLRPASFGQRTLAWSLDLLLLSPLLVWLAWPPLARALAATGDWLAQVQGWMVERMLADDALPSVAALGESLLADPVQGPAARAQVAQLSAAIVHASLVIAVVAMVYFVAFEASAWQATPGKRLLGLRVEGTDGARLSWSRALARHVAGVASWLTLNIGHLLVALRPDRRALHDLLAGTCVGARGPLPVWGRALLGLLAAIAVLAPVAWVMQALAQVAGG
jgi:uncharacterized RDD family membrane protein YckC